MSPEAFARSRLLAELRAAGRWDLAVIGGGATGLGVALDAAARGLAVALVEAEDFAKGTSSRATKLVHGGVRYLAQKGEFGIYLVRRRGQQALSPEDPSAGLPASGRAR